MKVSSDEDTHFEVVGINSFWSVFLFVYLNNLEVAEIDVGYDFPHRFTNMNKYNIFGTGKYNPYSIMNNILINQICNHLRKEFMVK